MARFTNADTLPIRTWYTLGAAHPSPLNTLADLRRALGSGATSQPQAPEAAQQDFDRQVQAIIQNYQNRLVEHASHYRTTLQAHARRLLLKGAMVEIALGQQRTLFTEEAYPLNFDESAVAGLKRHKSPWSWMLHINGSPLPRPNNADPFFAKIRNHKPEKLKDRFKELTEEAKGVVKEWRAIDQVK